MDYKTEELIRDVVYEWVRQARMFTAFEVSLAVKKRGVQERHRNMRDFVHDVIFEAAVEDGDYTRTLLDVGAPTQAWVYHPVTANPYVYEPLERGDQSSPAPRPAPTTMPNSPPSCPPPQGLRRTQRLTRGTSFSSSIPPGAYGTDQRGRLCLPVGVLLQIGATPGSQVDVLCDEQNEQLIITKTDSAHHTTSDTNYTVEDDGNVRITQTTLEKAGIDGLQCYRVEGKNSVITVQSYG